MFEAAERILCLRAQIAWLWQRLLLSAIGRKEGKETRYPRWEEARKERTHSRRGTDSSHGLVKSPHDVEYRREACSSTGGRKRTPPLIASSVRFCPYFATNKLSVVHWNTRKSFRRVTFPPVDLRSVGEIRKIERSRVWRNKKNKEEPGGICGWVKNGKADRDLMGNFV